jgi:hypothetical protein
MAGDDGEEYSVAEEASRRDSVSREEEGNGLRWTDKAGPEGGREREKGRAAGDWAR